MVAKSISYKKLLGSIGKAADVGGWWYEIDSQTLGWTDEVCAIHELEAGVQPDTKTALGFYLPPYDTQVTAAFAQLLTTGEPYKIKAMIKTAKGNVKWVMTHGAAHYRRNKMTAVYGAFQDITADVQESERQQRTADTTRVTLDSLVEALVAIDISGKITAFNKAAESIFQYQRADILGKPIETLMPEPYRSYHSNYMHNYHKTKDAKIIGIGREVTGLRADGSTFPMHLSVNHIDGPDGKGYVGTIRDLSEEKRIAQKLEWLSHYDDVTGLPNRVSLISYLSKTDSQKSLTLVAINLDYFSKINLAHGYAEGNIVLKTVAERLTAIAGEHHIAGKDIADRFWLIIDNNYVLDVKKILRQLVDALTQPIAGSGIEHFFTVSIGVASRQRSDMLNDLVSRAETALFSAKQKGVGQMCFYEAMLAEQIVAEYNMELALREALQKQQLECWLQPQVNKQFKLVSAEVLVRWKGDDGKYIAPDKFIGIAEKTGLIAPLGYFVAQQTAKMLASINQIAADFRLAMNVSPQQFVQPNFIAELVSSFSQHQANLSNLIVEITESVLSCDIESVNGLLAELGNYGVKISIDDFGTGHSNIKRIIDMPISELKIDKQFVLDCCSDEKSEYLLSAIISLAKVMHHTTVAEGVETLEIAEHCIKLGVDTLQGYYFGKAVPFSEFYQILSQGRTLPHTR